MSTVEKEINSEIPLDTERMFVYIYSTIVLIIMVVCALFLFAPLP